MNPQEKIMLQELIEKYTILMNNNEFNIYLKSLNDVIININNKISGLFSNPTSGCKSFEEYKYYLGQLHGIEKAVHLPIEMIKLAKETLEQTKD